MEEVDRLSITTVKSGPLQSVFKRMLHRSNLLPELHPGFVNDGEVTPEKVTFLKDVLGVLEQELNRKLEPMPDELRMRLGEISALAEFLSNGNVNEAALAHHINTGRRTLTPREQILKVGSTAAAAYSGFMVENERRTDGGHIEPEQAFSELEVDNETGSESVFETVIPGFESLHNTIIDLYEADRLLPHQSAAEKIKLTQSLLLLFEQAASTSSDGAKREALARARKRLRTDIERSPTLNKPKQTDQHMLAGKALMQQLIQSDGRFGPTTPSYKSMTELAIMARISIPQLEDGPQARKYIESRIAYTLNVMYSEET